MRDVGRSHGEAGWAREHDWEARGAAMRGSASPLDCAPRVQRADESRRARRGPGGGVRVPRVVSAVAYKFYTVLHACPRMPHFLQTAGRVAQQARPIHTHTA